MEVIMHYVKHVMSRYGVCCTIFDGYSSEIPWFQRSVDTTSSHIQIDEEVQVSINQELFLSNDKNKA